MSEQKLNETLHDFEPTMIPDYLGTKGDTLILAQPDEIRHRVEMTIRTMNFTRENTHLLNAIRAVKYA